MISIDKRKFQPVIIFGNGFVAYKHKFFDYACGNVAFVRLYINRFAYFVKNYFTFGKVEINGASSLSFNKKQISKTEHILEHIDKRSVFFTIG